MRLGQGRARHRTGTQTEEKTAAFLVRRCVTLPPRNISSAQGFWSSCGLPSSDCRWLQKRRPTGCCSAACSPRSSASHGCTAGHRQRGRARAFHFINFTQRNRADDHLDAGTSLRADLFRRLSSSLFRQRLEAIPHRACWHSNVCLRLCAAAAISKPCCLGSGAHADINLNASKDLPNFWLFMELVSKVHPPLERYKQSQSSWLM